MNIHTLRFKPGEDLLQELNAFLEHEHIQAGCILTCVGSLQNATLRLADQDQHTHEEGPFEIVSLVGTLSRNGSHLHLSLSRSDGTTLGGHLVPGCQIYTTAEIVTAEFPALRYVREPCPESGYPELVVKSSREQKTG
jgi:hypothetical protein